MERVKKVQQVEELTGTFGNASLVVITQQTGLTVAEAGELRRRARDAGARYKVTKNRLAKLALKGSSFEQLTPLFTGPTAITVSEDPVAAAKVVVDFAKTNEKLAIIGGALGNKPLDSAEITALAKLPSLDELRAKLIALVQTPATRIASVVQAPAGQVARVIGAYGASGGDS